VALADKIDTLTGFWAIDEKPTGSKDPFALRRAALGVIRLVLTNGRRLNLKVFLLRASREVREELRQDELQRLFRREAELSGRIAELGRSTSEEAGREADRLQAEIDTSESRRAEMVDEFDREARPDPTDVIDLLAFLQDRLKVHLRDQGIRHDVIDACLAMPGNDDLVLLVRRAEALAVFLGTSDGTNLLQGFKRAANILSQAEAKDGVEYSYGADPKWAEGEEERALFAALDAAEPRIREAMGQEDFPAAMSQLASLRAPIDAFFEAVQVNTDNGVIRRNRLNLLSRIRRLCLEVADLTRVEG
jgi:glycyl-tRNA synthetase beta chain